MFRRVTWSTAGSRRSRGAGDPSLGALLLASLAFSPGCGASGGAPSAADGGDAMLTGDASASSDATVASDAAPFDATADSGPAEPDAVTGEPDASGGEDAESEEGGTDAGATPIVAPPDTWTWVDFPDSKCAAGTATGVAVNPHAGATDLLVYFEGGGSCYDATTCWGPSPGADNLTGYDRTTFAEAKQLAYPALVRSTPGSPFAAMNMVYIPYCTGDLHAGATEASFMVNGVATPTYFWGANDLDLFLRRLAVTFASPSRVLSFGTSAGGFGSFLSFDRLAKAFGVRVDVIDDSGPPLTKVGSSDNSGLFDVWGLVPPAGCDACNSFLDIMEFDRRAQPASRLGFLSLAEDTVISADFGYSLSTYGPAIESLFSTNFSGDPNVATYVVDGDPGHVVESQPALEPDYLPWLTSLVDDSAGWMDSELDAGVDGG